MPKKTSSISSRGISIRVSRGSGKTFVLKNWETDGFAAFLGSTAGDIPQNVAGDLIAWLSAPQRGGTRARHEAHDSSALVLNGAEGNRVLDYAQSGLRRVINAVVPRVNADMLTCSSYDAMVYGSDAQSVQQSLTQTTPNRCAVPRALDHSSGWNYQLGGRCDQEILVAPR